jgi:hypothetical protein
VSAVGQGGMPSAAELVDAVRECLRNDVSPVVQSSGDARAHHLLRICVAALGQVERELDLAAEIGAAHRSRLDLLGVADDAALVAEIRGGVSDVRRTEIVRKLRAAVADDLRIVAPPRTSPRSAPGQPAGPSSGRQ